jgi:predicted nucleotidyltransferase
MEEIGRSIEKLPAAFQSVLDSTTAALKASLGENLHSLIIYGSLVRGDFDPKSSDINLLIVLKVATPKAHEAIRDAIRSKVRISPIILPSLGCERTMAVFGLKFLSMKRNYRVLAGVDVLQPFALAPDQFRFLAEQELRNLVLRTTNAYVTSVNAPKRFSMFIRQNAAQFIIVLSDAARTAGNDLVGPLAGRLGKLGEIFGADTTVLEEILRRRRSRGGSSDGDLELYPPLQTILGQALEWMEAHSAIGNDTQ